MVTYDDSGQRVPDLLAGACASIRCCVATPRANGPYIQHAAGDAATRPARRLEKHPKSAGDDEVGCEVGCEVGDVVGDEAGDSALARTLVGDELQTSWAA
jgi:hypothetical protein